jgi:hypothetical protein
MAGKGKIARLPLVVRDEVNRHLKGEGAEALNEQRRRFMTGEWCADKPIFEDWPKEAPPSNPPEATKAN